MAAGIDAIPTRPRWDEGRYARWLTTTDHKDLGVLSVATSLCFLAVGVIVSVAMLAQTGAAPAGRRELVTVHLAAAAFLVFVPLVNGLGMFIVPLQVGARTFAFPRLAAFGYWLSALGGLTVLLGFLNAGTGSCGWSCDTPLTDVSAGGHTGDLWLLALVLLAAASIVSCVCTLTTVYTRAAPEVTSERRPAFTRLFAAYAALSIPLAALAGAVSVLLLLDRRGHVHLGSATIRDLAWTLGYPQLLILLLPAVAIVAQVWRTQRPTSALLYAVGVVAAVAGGVFGVVAESPFQWSTVLAVSEYTVVATLLFAVFAGLHNWWPKLFGRVLDEGLGGQAFSFMAIGLALAFVPVYVGHHVYTYPHFLSWHADARLSTVGAGAFAFGVLLFVVNIVRTNVLHLGRRAGNDPWLGDTLEWFTTSPPPPHNFDSLPAIESAEPLGDLRRKLRGRGEL
ncbi:MAG: cbb3-type cytochrome c oxidase subunit I [Gaiellaceae bacterium]